MLERVIITIGREFGSEGHEIGRMLAERLGIEIFDKDLLYKVAEQSGMTVSQLAELDEKKQSGWLQSDWRFDYRYGALEDQLFKLQSQMIRQLADQKSCIIIGRLGDYILKDYPNCLKVFVYAPFEERVKIISRKHQLPESQAKKWVKSMDDARARYYHYYSNQKWNAKEGKDLLLNRATLGIEGCVAILEAMVKGKVIMS